jgi:hypothetical protein
MKVIFLDFYGVMDGPLDRKPNERWVGLASHCGALINDLCDRTGAVIVISSDAAKRWDLKDKGWTLEGEQGWDPGEARYDIADHKTCIEDLVDIGIARMLIIGCTFQPPSSIALFERPREIRDWLADHPEVTEYVVFDDKPLPFTRANIDWCLHRLGSGDTPTDQRLREAVLTYEEGAEMEPHFVHVDGQKGLTRADVERAVGILGG